MDAHAKHKDMVFAAAGAHLHTQQISRLRSEGRQKSMQDRGLQETAGYNTNACYRDLVQGKVSPGQILCSFSREGKGRRA